MPCPSRPPHGCQSTLHRRTERNVAAVYHGQHVPTPTAAAAWRANTAVRTAAWWPWPLTLKMASWVTSDVGYLCANFGLPRPLYYWLRPDVRDRQTDVRQHDRLMPPPIGVGHNNALELDLVVRQYYTYITNHVKLANEEITMNGLSNSLSS